MKRPEISDHLTNDPLKEQKRKLEIILALNGTMIIAFCVWSTIKIIMELFFGNIIDENYLSSYQPFLTSESQIKIFILFLMLPFLLLDFFIRYYVGKSALMESHGKVMKEKRKRNYPKWAILLVLTGILSLSLYFRVESDENVISSALSFTMELISNLVTLHLIWAVHKLRDMQKICNQ